ncbi:adhesion G-protein coupled receptor G1-like isoform X2 [Cololabis saira]|uniref:adhesion G-protein coupled receptor G1-like isoform X2 n=1 Tax=Cololabis saira TaxID=129043 RepID=UPI002AD488E0|nr:adhesion G-protein coupled receptor G1-like isoform X2 [Cololabis saira]
MENRCYEDRIVNCTPSRSRSTGFLLMRVNTSEEANVSPTQQHAVHIPSSALQRSRGSGSSEEVVLVTSVINSTYFKTRPRPPRKGSRIFLPPQGPQGVVLGELVLAVKAGIIPLRNISPPIKLIFKKNPTVQNGTCVFWKEPENENEADGWSTDGCNTTNTGDSFICSCDHLSFFAVLVNPDISVDETNARNLNYITYIGSALSVLFAFMSLFIYISLHRRRPEKATGLHMQLSAALLCLHLTFLLCNLWLWLPFGTGDGLVCRGLGLFLHWSLLATLAWLALEGFHLYLLLVRVFNIYVRRYLLKVSAVGWGFPTLAAFACGVSGVYGKYELQIGEGNNRTSTAQMCWVQSPAGHAVIYVTVGVLCLVVLYNSCMLALVVFQLWGSRDRSGRSGWSKTGADGTKMSREKAAELWRNGVTVLGLSCVLGLPWGLASATYMSLPGIYIFTVLNSLQGFFVFLWSVALSRKSRCDSSSSAREPSSQKMMTTSFNH